LAGRLLVVFLLLLLISWLLLAAAQVVSGEIEAVVAAVRGALELQRVHQAAGQAQNHKLF